MRIRTIFAVLPMLVLAACSAATPSDTAVSEMAKPHSSAPAASSGPPPGAAGKISPDMVGKVSPVAAFKGLGEYFNIEIQSQGGQTAEGMRHRVHLIWGTPVSAVGTHDAEGTLFYRSTPDRSMPDTVRGAPILLDGTLQTAQGPKTIRVEITTEACTDDADQPHPQRVKIALQGETGMQGCGDLAVY